MVLRTALPAILVALLALPVQAAEIELHPNLTYCTVGDRELQVDLVKPVGKGPFPAIVFVHGGGWRGGNRGGYTGLIKQAAERGYVAMTVTYRLTDPDEGGKAKHPYPAAVHDVKCAVRWLRANAQKYGVDPQRIGATGGSAGGHLSLMLGTTDGGAKLEGEGGYPDRSSRVQAVVNYFGPTDMPALGETSDGARPIVESFLAGKAADHADLWRQASPITYVTEDDPPTLTIHGADDKLVPPDQARRFDAAMKKAGATHELLILEGQGHGFRGEANTRATEAMFRFFDEHLKASE
jgi:acetyl esterase/lipase